MDNDQSSTARKWLTVNELDGVFAAIEKTRHHRARDRAIFRVAYHAGLRASEVGLLDLNDYDETTGRLVVRRLKRSLTCTLHLPARARKAIGGWLRVRGRASGSLFVSQRGLPISRQMLDVLMRRYGREGGVPPSLRHFHTLKHSCAVHLLERGVPVADVQDWIGHRAISSTMVYAQVTSAMRDRLARELRDW
jgi:site-specific recombinase XerD